MPRLNFVIRALICTLFVFLPLQSMDKWFYDHFFRLRGKNRQMTNIVLVRVSDAKFAQLLNHEKTSSLPEEIVEQPRHSIWHHRFYETVLDKIEGDSPKAVVFTQYFEWTEPKNISAPKYENVFFSSTINEENKIIPPPSKLIHGGNYGFSILFPDPDNVVRKSNLIFSSNRSIALKLQQFLEKTPTQRNLIEPLWIDFRGPDGTFPNYDIWEVYDEPTTSGRFRDKIVLIGREGSPSTNMETPYGSMSRLEIQANAVDTFLRGKELTILPRYVSLILASFCVVLAIVIIFFFPLTLAWLLLLLTALLLVLMTLFFFAELKIWYGIANPLFCIFGTHLLMVGYKLGKQEEEQWRIQQESQYLKEMDEFKNNFISLFSHDLKTPIAKIKAVTDRILTEKKKDLSEDIITDLKTIDKTNSELARFIGDILKVTKMESMVTELRRDVVDINRLVETSVHRLKFLADEKHITLVQDLEPLFCIEGDMDLLQEVVINLLENAIKYSRPNTQVVIRTREKNEETVVSILDQGMGIPADEIPRVTGKFYRGKKGAEQAKGSGLGLYLAKYFVELHRGHLSIESTLGEGTTVSFSLPIKSSF